MNPFENKRLKEKQQLKAKKGEKTENPIQWSFIHSFAKFPC
jgi:hypothetical protein